MGPDCHRFLGTAEWQLLSWTHRKGGSLSSAEASSSSTHMSQLSIHLLGPFQVTLNAQPVTGFAYDKVRALLAYLAVEAETPHRREALATLFWPNHPPKLARQSLRQSLTTLRRAIPDRDTSSPYLLIERDTVQFDRSAETWLDVEEVRAHLRAIRTHHHADIEACQSCIHHLEEVTALYRGEFLQDLLLGDCAEFENWALVHREKFRAQVVTALYHLAQHHAHRGKYALAQSFAMRQVEMEPYREEAHRQLMRILARSGQRTAALAQYASCRRILSEELGVEPSRKTKALYERIRSARETRPHNLPASLTTLIGREAELQKIAEHLANPTCRLLTLTGPGGIGKTRLALQAAREQVGIFLHGVYLVPLAGLSSAEFLVPTIADALGFSFATPEDPQAQLVNYLREKEMLLVLDNFDHLLDGTVLLLEILREAPNIKILVTSRERLKLQAEWVLNVRGLSFPSTSTQEEVERFSAVQLFCDRARRVEPHFALSGETRPAVARICTLVEGMPLAIELAAASVSAFSCAQIAAQLERSLDALATTMGDVPTRHRSVRATFEYGWNLLSENERMVAARLSVFRGPFGLRAAQAVTGATIPELRSLVNKSFLSRRQGRRYDIHPLLRRFAAEKLSAVPHEEESTRDKHCTFYANFLHRQEPALRSGQRRAALAEIDAVIDDIRASWQWAVGRANLEAIALCLDGLWGAYWAWNWFYEGKRVFEQAEQAALAVKEVDRLLLARIWTRQAEFDSWLAHYDAAKEKLQRSVEIFQGNQAQHELAIALDLFSRVEYFRGAYDQAREHLQACLEICRQIDDRAGLAQALNALANVLCEESADYEQARRLYDESLAIARQIGDELSIARVLINQGALAQQMGDYAEAEQLYRESLTIYREVDYRYGQSAALRYLGQVTSLLGDHDSARELLQQSLDLDRESGDRYSAANSLKQFGNVAIKVGAYEESRARFAEALGLAMEIRAQKLALDILLGIAHLFQKEGRRERALELLAFVLHCATGGQELKDCANGFFAELAADIPTDAVARYHEQAEHQTLSEVATSVLAELGSVLAKRR